VSGHDIRNLVFSPDFAVDGTAYLASLYDGVLRSVDGGWTWAPSNAGLPPDAARVLAISPDFRRDDTLHLVTQGWVWRSVDRGETWSVVPGFVRVDDGHPTIVSGGAWASVTQAGGYADSLVVSSVADATRELLLHGDSVTWIAARDDESGLAEVWVDDVLEATVDLYAPAPEFGARVFTRDFGAVGWHRIRVRVTGAANGASTGVFVKSDGFESRF